MFANNTLLENVGTCHPFGFLHLCMFIIKYVLLLCYIIMSEISIREPNTSGGTCIYLNKPCECNSVRAESTSKYFSYEEKFYIA